MHAVIIQRLASLSTSFIPYVPEEKSLLLQNEEKKSGSETRKKEGPKLFLDSVQVS
jgi:hypothetical protein